MSLNFVFIALNEAEITVRLGNKIVKERFKTGAEPQRDVMGLFVQHGVTEEEAFQELGLQV